MLAGRSLPHAVMMMIPEAYRDRDDLADELRASTPTTRASWSRGTGRPSVAFTDGRVVGATLDRNGLRPGRWVETTDGYVVLGSETGVLDDRAGATSSATAACSRASCSSSTSSRAASSRTRRSSAQVARQQPYGEWYRRATSSTSTTCPTRSAARRRASSRCAPRQLAFGYTQEDLRVLIAPMAANGEEPIGSMGNDAALAVLSDQRRRCSPTSSSSSRRSRTRRSTRSARRS